MTSEKRPFSIGKARESILGAQESISPEFFNSWAAYLQAKVREPEIASFLATASSSELLSWTSDALEAVYGKQDDESSASSSGHDSLALLQEPANSWKILRNGLNSVVIQEVVSSVSKDVLESIAAIAQDTSKALQIVLPNGERLATLSADSDQGSQLLAAAREQKSQTRKAVRSIFFSKEIEDSFSAKSNAAVDVVSEDQQQNTYFVFERGSATTPGITTGTYKIFKIQSSENEKGVVIHSIELQADDVSELGITSTVLHHFFEKYLVAWAGEQLGTNSQYSGVLHALGKALYEGREADELQALVLFSPVEPDSSEGLITNSLRLIVDGYDTGLDQIEHLHELQSVTEYLAAVKEQQQVPGVALQLISLLETKYPAALSSLTDEEQEQLSSAVEEYLGAIINGKAIGAEAKQVLSRELTLPYRTIPLQQLLDDLLYGFITNQTSLKTENEPAKVSLRIPLLLARMHLQLFSEFINLSSRGIFELDSENAPKSILEFTSYANRPATVATGCPALPAGVIPKLAGLYQQVSSALKKL